MRAETGEEHADDLEVGAYAQTETVEIAGSIGVAALATDPKNP